MVLEQELYKRLLKSESENKKLRLKIESYEKRYEYNQNFQRQHFQYKYCFLPLKKAYLEMYKQCIELYNLLKDLYILYSKNLLLNPDFNVKLNEAQQKAIINESRVILKKFKTENIPEKIEIKNDLEPKPAKEKELRRFVVKKQTNK